MTDAGSGMYYLCVCGSIVAVVQSAGAVLFLCFTGKVHGSLARAGKVKNQTPKVAKQEKRKAVNGRGKRRAQYNRRFVNVMARGGRKGPNSQT